ncbi:MAG: DUF1385 domain-containing protein [Eubacteriales bacterium]|nr:DUF1385 domain-containing protein [Eubacteriales bacterium]
MKKRLDQATEPVAVEKKKTTIGGQALIEGLMMIGPDKKVMAVRKPDGTIYLEELAMTRWSGLANVLFVRGSVRLFQQLVTGTRALLRSAELLDEESVAIPKPVVRQTVVDSVLSTDVVADVATDAAADIMTDAVTDTTTDISTGSTETIESVPTPAKKARRTIKDRFESLNQKIDHYLTHHSEVMLYLSAVGGILFSVILFILLPNLLTTGIAHWTNLSASAGRLSSILLNLIEGVIRITIFIAYLFLASRMSEIQRVWMYHGAEHKTIACYEAEKPLTVENVRLFSRFHPRCGTSFMFLVILVSIIVFSLIGWWSPWINLLIRFVLVPLVAGIAYEIIRLAGRYDNWLTRGISRPGLWLQRLTTAEPNDKILEVSIAAMQAVLPEEEGRDQW